MFDVAGYEGKFIKVSLNDGTIFTAKCITFMLAESCDEEFNSMVVKVKDIIETKHNENIVDGITTTVYEDEVKLIEEL